MHGVCFGVPMHTISFQKNGTVNLVLSVLCVRGLCECAHVRERESLITVPSYCQNVLVQHRQVAVLKI